METQAYIRMIIKSVKEWLITQLTNQPTIIDMYIYIYKSYREK